MLKIKLVSLMLILIVSCTNETIYSGKIINQDNLSNINYKTKLDLINNLGEPSYIDPIEKKFFYFSEKKEITSAFKKQTKYSYIFVFTIDENEDVISSKVLDLSNKNKIKIISEETDNRIVKQGLLERIFGGVGTQQEFPTSP